MTKEIEKIIARFKKEVGKSKQMTAREMKLIEICIDELVVKNCNIPCVSSLLPFTNTEIDDLEKELLQRYGFDGCAIKAESQFEIMDFIDFLKRKGNNC